MSSDQFLSPVGFKFNIKKLPEFNKFVQAVTFPGVNMGYPNQPTPFKALPVPGDHIEFGVIDVTFKINEDFSNYMEIYNWIRGLGFPHEHEEYKELYEAGQASYGEGLFSDAYLIVLNSAMRGIAQIEIQDIFPVSMGDIVFDARDTTIEYMECSAQFQFKDYTIKSLT